MAHPPSESPRSPGTTQPPESVLELLELLGVAMCEAGESTDRITMILDEVATSFGTHGVRYFVLPTGVFVRVEAGGATRVDFTPAGNVALRLDQVDALYRLIDDLRHQRTDLEAARARLDGLRAAKPRFGPLGTILGTPVLILGLGLMLNPSPDAIPAYLVLGLVVGGLRWWAERVHTLSLVLPVVAAFVVTWVSFGIVAPLLGVPPLDLVIPSLITFLPGAALTMGTVELSLGAMIAGSSRLVYGLARLLLLSFGITVGVQVAGLPASLPDPGPGLGAWAPWVGVVVIGLGHYLASSVPRRTFGWMLVVLYTAYAVQAVAGALLGSLGGSFLAAAVVLPVAYAIHDRGGGPPVPVTFLPAFWLLVPGALGLEGVTEMVDANQAAGLGDLVNAFLTIVAIAIGVLVGAGIAERTGRLTATWNGV